MSNGENMIMGALLCFAFMCWSALMFVAGGDTAPDLHSAQQACEAELRRSESCEQVWVKG